MSAHAHGPHPALYVAVVMGKELVRHPGEQKFMVLGHVRQCEIQGFTAIGVDDSAAIAYVAFKPMAEDIVAAMNAHHALVSALQAIVKVREEWRESAARGEIEDMHLYTRETLEQCVADLDSILTVKVQKEALASLSSEEQRQVKDEKADTHVDSSCPHGQPSDRRDVTGRLVTGQEQAD